MNRDALNLILSVFILMTSAVSFAAANDDTVTFYAGIDMQYCDLSGGCYGSTFGAPEWTIKLNLVDSSYCYWTGRSELHREFRGKSYTASVFVEEWQPPFSNNRITVTIGEDGHPETRSRLSFWTANLHDFIRFDLQAMEETTPQGPQHAVLSFGPIYQLPGGGQN